MTLGSAQAQTALEPMVITGTRQLQSMQTLPMSIDRIDSDTIRDQQWQINLSESLQRVPGLNIQNRSNYAQDLQISSRGFGGRASFGVRGIRLYSDGIPAAGPDGQGQVSHFSLGSAQRIEVLRGPFAVMYGNAAGGVIQIFTDDAPKEPTTTFSTGTGSNHARRYAVNSAGTAGAVGIVGEYSKFYADGFRPQSAANRTAGNAKLTGNWGDTRITFVGNSLDLDAYDPLGLTRVQLDADPKQTSSLATQFNTRKSTRQTQAGLRAERSFGNHNIDGVIYSGTRSVVAWQSIPVATQTAATQPGGVIDFDRGYSGGEFKYTYKATWGSVAAGLSSEGSAEDRRGFENFIGTALGVTGKLRRNEHNTVRSKDAFAQAEFLVTDSLRVNAGARASKVRFVTNDLYIVPGKNPDDSGESSFSKTTPALGVSWAMVPNVNVYASVGQGYETPTFNELSYRAGGQTGLNFDLKPSSSKNAELGVKLRLSGWRVTAAYFDSKTNDEIVTPTNTGGRSTFQNAGKTSRKGFELATSASLLEGLDLNLSYSQLKARYLDAFNTCVAAPCTVANVPVNAGNTLPGIPNRAAYAELKYTHSSGFSGGLEYKNQGKVFVNDTNTDFAAAYGVANIKLGFSANTGPWKFNVGARVENLTNKKFAGSVIVNEGNSRFFEPGQGKNWLINANAAFTFK